MMFDVLHDSTNPDGMLRAVHAALKPDGSFILLEQNAPEDPMHPPHPGKAILLGYSTLYCLPNSMADDGASGAGAAGFPESQVRQAASEAGFSNVEKIDSGP